MRLLLSLWAVLCVALFLPAYYFSRSLNEDILRETKEDATRRLNIAQWAYASMDGLQDAERLQDWVVEWGKQLEGRITYVADGGVVIADSGVTFADIGNLDNHASRPEIMAARNREVGISIRYSGTMHMDLLYVAKSVERSGNIPAGVLRVAVPFSPVNVRLDRLKTFYTGVLILAFMATTFLVYGLTRQLDRSVGTMIETAEAIGKGDFKQRVHFYPGQEYFPLGFAINQMAERIESHVQTITTQKRQLEAILNGMQEGVMLLDSRGRIHAVNQAFKRMAAGTQQIVGRKPLEAIRSTELQEACDRAMASNTDQRSRPLSLQIVHEGEKTYDVNIVRVKSEQRAQGAIVVFHDISELKRLEKVRQDFIANVSHELRTPLTSIKGYTETLLAEPEMDPEALRSSLQVILRNADHMVKMANDLLELARIEAFPHKVGVEPVDASAVLHAAWGSCDSLADAKGVRMESDLSEGPLWVSANFDQLLQVFRNLLENAIRYSPNNGTISVSGEVREGMVAFGVKDEGPGIPKHEQKRIFERFYRVEKHRTGSHPGSTGLGLAICRHIILNHGGSIWAESPPPDGTKGSIIHFTLRAAPAAENEASPIV
jgi:two-component system phosphate regulon sensor histidine kinase PhoR